MKITKATLEKTIEELESDLLGANNRLKRMSQEIATASNKIDGQAKELKKLKQMEKNIFEIDTAISAIMAVSCAEMDNWYKSQTYQQSEEPQAKRPKSSELFDALMHVKATLHVTYQETPPGGYFR